MMAMQVNPRKMVAVFTLLSCVRKALIKIIVHASLNATNTLIESCANIHAMTNDIFAPIAGECV
jgi:hypothetical protein